MCHLFSISNRDEVASNGTWNVLEKDFEFSLRPVLN